MTRPSPAEQPLLADPPLSRPMSRARATELSASGYRKAIAHRAALVRRSEDPAASRP